MKKQAIAYCRVSTEGQAQEGISLKAQRAKIEAWCTANDHQLLAVHVDAGISGGRADNRPALQKALTEACGQKAVMVVYALSRLARSTKDAIAISERLAKSGADLVSLTEKLDTTTAAGKLFFRLMISLSEFERDLVSERTRCAMAHLRIQGKRISGDPVRLRSRRRWRVGEKPKGTARDPADADASRSREKFARRSANPHAQAGSHENANDVGSRNHQRHPKAGRL